MPQPDFSALAKNIADPKLSHEAREIAIYHALRAAHRVPDGMVRMVGTDKRLLGTLPETVDGCVVGFGAIVYGPWDTESVCPLHVCIEASPTRNGPFPQIPLVCWGGPYHDAIPLSDDYYSTPEAAAAARSKA